MAKVKTALICQGGGMKGAFTAGVVYELANKFNIQNIDILIGISASAPTLTYFSAGQFSAIKDIWQNELGTPFLIKRSNFFKGKPVYDINYLIDEVFKNKYPLNLSRLQSSPINLYIPLYNYKSKKIEYYNNHDDQEKMNIWQALKATMVIHHQHLSQKETHRYYVDSSLINSLIFEKALSENATHFIVVINDRNLDFRFKDWLKYKIFCSFQAKNFPQEVKDKLKDYPKFRKISINRFKKFYQDHQVLFIHPDKKSKITTAMDKNWQIKRAVELGQKELNKKADHPILKVFQERSAELIKKLNNIFD
ncbi:hypothetical protein KKF32_04325 [Patescibacteria group bacterium]|nr:hypothetical protein [Patescibacteria group bacterium]